MSINGKALAVSSIGTLFIWSGIKGWSVLGTIGDVITGSKPTGQITNPLTSPTQPSGTVGTGVDGAPSIGQTVGEVTIADYALAYQGHAYKFGGAPGPDGSKPWDCSSFTNFVVGVRAGMAIPGYKAGKYTGTTHGPATGQWAVWPGMTSVKRADVQRGDIVVFLGHMGIAISNSHMISALNPRAGTKISAITGFGKPLVRIGRLK